MSGERRPSLQQIVNDAIAAGSRDVYTMIPAKVVRFDSTKQQADCQILVKNVTSNEEDEREVASWPVVTNVPVEFPGANGYRMTFPVTQGDLGSLVFSHRSMDKWLTGSGGEVDPQLDHDHGLNDAKFVPGLRPFGSPWQSFTTDKATIGSDTDANGRIAFGSNTVELGEGASSGVARQNDGVGNGTLNVVFGPGSGAATLSITYTPGDGSTPQNISGVGGTITLKEKITGGSSHIKAAD